MGVSRGKWQYKGAGMGLIHLAGPVLCTEYGETFYEMIGRGPSYVVESHAASFTLDAVIVHTILLGLRSATFQMPCLTPKTRRICDETKHPRHRINWFGGRILFPKRKGTANEGGIAVFLPQSGNFIPDQIRPGRRRRYWGGFNS